MSDTNFINPYNFIPLSKEKTEKKLEGELYTGVIEYSLLTRTPLFVPNTSNEKTFANSDIIKYKKVDEPDMGAKREKEKKYKDDHKSYDFFSYTDLSSFTDGVPTQPIPVIPGSEVRGMIRSNYEILTNSCMFSIDEEGTLVKRTAHAFEAGLIRRLVDENGKAVYSLYEAEDCILRKKDLYKKDADAWIEMYKDKSFKEGQVYRDFYVYSREKAAAAKALKEGKEKPEKSGHPVVAWKENNQFFTYVEYSDKKDKSIKHIARKNINPDYIDAIACGYIIKGEESLDGENKKHNLHVFYRKNDDVHPVDITILDRALDAYKVKNENSYNEYHREWNLFKNGKGNEYFPVYYSSVDENYNMLAPAMFTREIYKNKLKDIVKSHRKCKDAKHLCPACSLFGTLEKDCAHISKVRFTDLECDMDTTDLYHDIITLPEIGTPNPSNMEFYFKRPMEDALFWTADYWVDREMNVYLYTPENLLEINGRKFYWHSNLKSKDLKSEDATNRNTTIRPLKEGIQFKGKVYFEKIDKSELDTLLYVLKSGDDSTLGNKVHGYKLGRAKSFGFGSVEIAVDKVSLRKVVKTKESIQIKQERYEEYILPTFEKQIQEDFAKMTRFDFLEDVLREKKLSYPALDVLDETEEGFKWFVGNHVARKKKSKNGVDIFEVLDMPKKRKQMAYREYMEAMKPELQKTQYDDETTKKEKWENVKNNPKRY